MINEDDFITLEEIKMHCRIDEDFNFEDGELMLLRSAALIACQRHIGKKFDADLKWDNALKVGCLMFISHLYGDREMVADFEKTTVPLTVDALWSVYRDPGIH
ncbi:head-tail connector protein [Citrobacter braakii]|uniref:head-tail connector protein n=1 Tax=Citrobacter braakii TaxID=57706 RepID=UPI0040393077